VLNAAAQAINDPPLLGVAVLLAIVLGEVLKQTLGPIFAKGRGPGPEVQLLKRITELLEKVVDETSSILALAKINHEWHDFRDAEGRPLAYFPREDVYRRLDAIEERLRRLQHQTP